MVSFSRVKTQQQRVTGEDMDGRRDFDFEIGRWTVRHRRLQTRLAGASDWEGFSGESHMQPVLGGLGNVEDNLLNLPAGAYRALALRTYDTALGLWAIWWVDGRSPHMLGVPVKRRFENGLGRFNAEDNFEGRPILVEFQWCQTARARAGSRPFRPMPGRHGRSIGSWTSAEPNTLDSSAATAPLSSLIADHSSSTSRSLASIWVPG